MAAKTQREVCDLSKSDDDVSGAMRRTVGDNKAAIDLTHSDSDDEKSQHTRKAKKAKHALLTTAPSERRIVAFDVGRECTGVAILDTDARASRITCVRRLDVITSDIANDRSKGIVKRKTNEFLGRLASSGIDGLLQQLPPSCVHVLFEQPVAVVHGYGKNGDKGTTKAYIGHNYVVDGINRALYDRYVALGYHVLRVQPGEKGGVFKGLAAGKKASAKEKRELTKAHKQRSVEVAREVLALVSPEAVATFDSFPRRHDIADAINMIHDKVNSAPGRTKLLGRVDSPRVDRSRFALANKYKAYQVGRAKKGPGKSKK